MKREIRGLYITTFTKGPVEACQANILCLATVGLWRSRLVLVCLLSGHHMLHASFANIYAGLGSPDKKTRIEAKIRTLYNDILSLGRDVIGSFSLDH